MKKRKIFAIIIFCGFYGSSVFAQINFEQGTFTEVKSKAKAEKKLIFIDAFTSWCGPCKLMAKNVFTNDTVAQYYNSTFVNAKINMEEGEGREIAKQYSIKAYPTFLFIDGNGKLIHRAAGSMEAAKFIQLGKAAQIPEKSFMNLQEKYRSGARDVQFMIRYLAALDGASIDIKEPLNSYFNSQMEQNWVNRSNWNFINVYLKDDQSKVFQYLVKHADVYAEKYTADSVNNKIFNVYTDACEYSIYSKSSDSAKYFQMKEEIQKSGFIRSEEIILRSDMKYYQKKKEYVNYAKAAIPYIDKYKSKDADELKFAAYVFYENLREPAMLEKAEQWINKSCELDPNPQVCFNTFAFELSLIRKKQEAIKFQRKAIEFIKADPQKQYQDWIPEMEMKIAEWGK